jgi:hypothetical protein
MPRTGKSVVRKIKATCTNLQGFAAQRDITRTRDAYLIYTCCDKGNDKLRY